MAWHGFVELLSLIRHSYYHIFLSNPPPSCSVSNARVCINLGYRKLASLSPFKYALRSQQAAAQGALYLGQGMAITQAKVGIGPRARVDE